MAGPEAAAAAPRLAVPVLTVPVLTVPELTVPELTVPVLTVPELTVPELTVPVLTGRSGRHLLGLHALRVTKQAVGGGQDDDAQQDRAGGDVERHVNVERDDQQAGGVGAIPPPINRTKL